MYYLSVFGYNDNICLSRMRLNNVALAFFPGKMTEFTKKTANITPSQIIAALRTVCLPLKGKYIEGKYVEGINIDRTGKTRLKIEVDNADFASDLRRAIHQLDQLKGKFGIDLWTTFKASEVLSWVTPKKQRCNCEAPLDEACIFEITDVLVFQLKPLPRGHYYDYGVDLCVRLVF